MPSVSLLGSIASALVSTAGHFELVIDHHRSSAYVKSVDGGHIKSNVIDEPIGHHHDRIKHTTVAEIEPVTAELGFSGADPVMLWMQSCWRRDIQRRSGE